MSTALLTTKLYVPPLRQELVRRHHLLDRLSEGLRAGRRLILLSAPAGFGKTTLLAHWVQEVTAVPASSADSQASSPRAAWLSLDEEDNDPAHFAAYLVAALQSVDPNIGSDLQVPQEPRQPQLRDLLIRLLNQVSTLPFDLLLVLDDFHLIHAQAIHEGLTFLLDHLPPHMHVVIATRADPPLPVARLRGRGQLVELRQADLRFQHEEVAAFLNQALGLGLAEGELAALAMRTEGWVAGLQMAAIAVQAMRRQAPSRLSPPAFARADVSTFVQAFAGSNRHILDYLMDEVLAYQPEHVQSFLLQTSILTRLCGPLCDSLLDRTDGQAILEQLERDNLFLVPLDTDRCWYRYHRLFADLLQQLLQRRQPDVVPGLHRQASTWHEQQGLMDPTIRHAIAAGDSDRAACLIEQIAERTMLQSEMSTLQAWVEALPENVLRARPLLCVYHAIALLLNGYPLQAVEARLQQAGAADAGDAVSGHVTMLRGLFAAYEGEASESARLARRALQLLPPESRFFRSFVAGYLAYAYMYSSDVATATEALQDAVRIAREAGNLTNAVLALVHLAELASLQGHMDEGKALYEEAVQEGTDAQGKRHPIAGVALMGLGGLLREENDLETAARLMLEGIDLAKQWGEVAAVGGYVRLVQVRQAEGDLDGAHRALAQADRLAVKSEVMKLDDVYVDMIKATVAAREGNLAAAWPWAEKRGLIGDRSGSELEPEEGSPAPSFVRIIEYMTLGKIYIAADQPDQALELLQPLLRVATAEGWTTLVVRIHILEAMAWQARGDMDQALARLERALSLAVQAGFTRSFLDEGLPMAQLLYEAVTRGIASHRAGRLLATFPEREWQPVASAATTAAGEALIEPLSDREIEVLELVARGLSNQQIALRLHLALPTIKWHTSNIYGKLAVSSRTEAVAKARALGLLPPH